MNILTREFFNKDSLTVAKELLGKTLVHQTGSRKISAKIVETESYMGINDKASHAYSGKKTQRTAVMYGKPGISYVYFIYGMYHCCNMVTGEEGTPQAVLIRALEPLNGLEQMAVNRYQKAYGDLTKSQKKALTNGPGKLCRAFAIDKSLNGTDLCAGPLYVEEGQGESFDIVAAKRVGVDYAEEAKDYLWRFYIRDNPYVSVK